MGNIDCNREKEHLAAAQRAKEMIFGASEVECVCKTFQLLADPGRLKMVLALLNGGMCVCHLAGVCDSTESAVSHQLRILRDNGIVRAKRMGKYVEYSIADEHISEIIRTGIAHLSCDKEND